MAGGRGGVGWWRAPGTLAPGLEVVDADPAGCDAAIDFTRGEAVLGNVTACLEAGVPVLVGTSGWEVGGLGFPEALMVDLEIVPEQRILVAATHGVGIFYLRLLPLD